MQGIKFSFDDQCSNDRSSTTKGVNFIFSSFPESFRATQTIPDLASCRFIRNDTSFRVLTISCWRPVNIPPWWRTSHISFANHGQPIVVESLIPSNCPTTRVARMSAVIFLFVRFGFHSCRVGWPWFSSILRYPIFLGVVCLARFRRWAIFERQF